MKILRTVLMVFSVFFAVAYSAVAEEIPRKNRSAEPAASSHTLAVIPFYSPEKIWLLYNPFVEYLKKETGQQWELKLYHNHEELLGHLCGGDITVALLGPVPLGRAYQRCKVKPFLVALNNSGEATYRSVLLTSDAAVNDLKQLRGRKVGFFRGSTAAHILPAKMLKDAGLGMEAVTPVFFDSQDKIVTSLLTGDVAAAGVKETLYRRFEKERVRVLKTSGPLPNFAFCAAPSASPGSRKNMSKALLKLKPLPGSRDAEIVKTWDDEVKHGFIVPPPDFLPAVLQTYEIYQEIMHEDR